MNDVSLQSSMGKRDASTPLNCAGQGRSQDLVSGVTTVIITVVPMHMKE